MTWSARLRDPGFRQLVRMGRVAAAKNRPKLPVHLVRYLSAFYRLGSSRSYGAMGGAGPIPWHVKDAYARRYGIDGDEFERFDRLLEALDAAWLEEQYRAAESKRKADENAGARRRGRRRPMISRTGETDDE